MKNNRLQTLSIFIILWMQIFTPAKIIAQTNCESYLDCQRTPETLDKVDYWTNYFFKLLRPEMRHKRVRMYHTLYRRELTEIRQVVNKVIDQSCQQPDINYYYSLLEKDKDSGNRDLSEAEALRGQLRWRIRDRRHHLHPRHRNNQTDSNQQPSNYNSKELFWDEQLWEDGYYWERTEDYFFEGLYQDLANAVFYARHPELSRDIEIKDNLNWATEWTFIRQYFANFEEERFLKQHLIPLCD